MASDADKIRQLAADLRKEAAVIEQQKMVKAAQIIRAGVGLNVLAEKVRYHGK